MSYASDVDSIAEINATVPGIAVSFDSTDLPPQIGIVPAALVIVAPGDWSKFGTDEYVTRVYVASALSGNPATAYQLCLQLIEAFYQTYNAIGSINGRPLMRYPHGHTKSARGFGTSGFYYTQKWGSTEFFGFEVYVPLGPRSPVIQ